MRAFDTFQPQHFTINPAMENSVREHRKVMGEVPRFTILRKIVKLKGCIRTTYPPDGWTYK